MGYCHVLPGETPSPPKSWRIFLPSSSPSPFCLVSCRVSLALADPHYYRTAGTEQSWGMESQEDRKEHRVEFALPCIALSLWLFSEEIIVYPLCSGSRKSTQSAKHAGVRCDAMEGKRPIRNDRGGSLEEFGATTPKGMRMVDMAQAC